MFGLLGTGLPIKYAHSGWAPKFFDLLGGFQNTLVIHKTSAIALSFVGAWHAVYLLWALKRYGYTSGMLPGIEDSLDSVRHALYLLGFRDKPPRYGRYTYLEKFEYLAIFYGMFVMGFSGFALWFPVTFAAILPRWVLDGLRIVHSNEAFVALISLAFGHFYTVHFSPQVFPSSPVWYSGKISLAHLAEEHPLEFDSLVERGVITPEQAVKYRHGNGEGHKLSGWRRALGVVELLLYSAVFYMLIVTFVPLLLS